MLSQQRPIIISRLKKSLTERIPLFSPAEHQLAVIRVAAGEVAGALDCNFYVKDTCIEDKVASRLMFGDSLLGRYLVEFFYHNSDKVSVNVSLFADECFLRLE